jgi:hypothetical protein
VPGWRGRGAEPLAGLGGDGGRVAQALQDRADGRLGLDAEGGPRGADVLADLVQELAPAVGGQVPQLGLQVPEVAVDEAVGAVGYGLSTILVQSSCLSRNSS